MNYSFEVFHRFTCGKCRSREEVSYGGAFTNDMEQPKPKLPSEWRVVDGVGLLCPSHKVEVTVRIDGQQEWQG